MLVQRRIFPSILRRYSVLQNFPTCAPSTSETSTATNRKTTETTQIDDDGFRPVIGLEIHAQIAAKSKLFSRAASNYWASSNTMVNFFDCALPGTLPSLNRRCVEAAIMTSLALNCRINLMSMFDRKHYFYSDLPTGYQITQQRRPIATDGWVEYIVQDDDRLVRPYVKRTKVIQVQLEQDSGKSIHDSMNKRSLVDLNRAGVALLEIVCHHDIESELEASCFAKELHLILRKIGVCEGKMERGQFRVDANISIHRPNEPLGPRTEVKNLNSFRFIRRALDFEIKRQMELRNSGQNVVNETLAFDFRTGKTSPMRDKEVRQDYRYMPEPNLPPLILDDSSSTKSGSKNDQQPSNQNRSKSHMDVEEIRQRMPELPAETRKKWIENFGLSLSDCVTLNANDNVSRAFDRLLEEKQFDPLRSLKALTEYGRTLAEEKVPWESSKVSWENLVESIEALVQDRISEYCFVELVRQMLKDPKKSAKVIIQEKNLFVLEDISEVEKMCQAVIDHTPKEVKKFKQGDEIQPMKRLMRAAGNRLHWRYPEWKMEKIFREKLAK